MITSYQFKAGGDILHLIFPEMDRTTGMYLIAAFVIAFTAARGHGVGGVSRPGDRRRW